MSTWDGDITPAMLLEHMRAMEQRICTTLRSEFREMLNKQLNEQSIGINAKFERVFYQIDALDKRLYDIEIEELPKKVRNHERRIKRVERHLVATR